MIVLWRTRRSKRRKMAAQVPYEGNWALGPKRGFPVPSEGLIWAERDQEGRCCDLQTRGRSLLGLLPKIKCRKERERKKHFLFIKKIRLCVPC